MRALGYLVPEFPGQTHAFFWREVAALRKLGIEAVLLSTRRPDRSIICHDWSGEAIARTTYLFPPGGAGLLAGAQAVLMKTSAVRQCLRQGSGGLARSLGLIAIGAGLAALARRRGFEHVHVHSCAEAANIAAFSNLLGGPSYSLTLHGDVDGYGPGQEFKWGGAAFGFVVSRALLPGLRAAVPLLDESKVDVAPMGVQVDRFTRRAPYAPGGGGKLRVISCGRLHQGKGHADLVRALAVLRHQGLDAELRIIGEGPDRADIERAIAETGVSAHVRLLGARPEAAVRDELEKAHVFALASHAEAIGVATMEAMCMGLPVVVTGVGGVPELVRDGVDGLLVPARDPPAMAKAIGSVLRDPDRARRMGESGAARVRAQFHSGVSAERLAARLSQRSESLSGVAVQAGAA